MARQPMPVPIGGLELPKDIGLAGSAAESIQQRWNTIGQVDARLQSAGIHANMMPDISCPPVTTEQLTTTDITQFTTLFSAQLRWYNYVVRLLADVRSILVQVENSMDMIAARKREDFRALNTSRKKAMSKEEMADLILLDPTYNSIKLQHQELEQQRIKLDAWADTLERNLRTVSRQIENRRNEGGMGNREGNMASDARAARWGSGRS